MGVGALGGKGPEGASAGEAEFDELLNKEILKGASRQKRGEPRALLDVSDGISGTSSSGKQSRGGELLAELVERKNQEGLSSENFRQIVPQGGGRAEPSREQFWGMDALPRLIKKENRGGHPQENSPQVADKEGMKISLLWKNGEIVKNRETPISKEQQGEKLFFNSRNNEEIARIGGRNSGELLKSKHSQDMPASNHEIILQDILSTKNNEMAGNSEFGHNLDILKLGDTKNVDTVGLVNKITDYLIQNGIKNLDFLEVIVDHEDLGKFKIDAQKIDTRGLIDMKVEVTSFEGREFFQENEALLLKDLARAGVNIQDFEIIDSKERILQNSFFIKEDNSPNGTEKDLQNQKEYYQEEKEEHKRDERERRFHKEFVNEEEQDA